MHHWPTNSTALLADMQEQAQCHNWLDLAKGDDVFEEPEAEDVAMQSSSAGPSGRAAAAPQPEADQAELTQAAAMGAWSQGPPVNVFFGRKEDVPRKGRRRRTGGGR